jgi:NDP-sugar pyrophosphorylase family protein
MMNVLITVNHSFESLVPLCAEEPVSILPLAGKAILEHVLEAVVELEAERITIAASGNIVELRHLVSDGERWGVALSTISAKPNEAYEDIYKRSSNLQNRDTLVVPCDRIYISNFAEILGTLKKHSVSDQGATSRETGVTFLPAAADLNSTKSIDTPKLTVHKIHTPADFHSASLASLSGELGPLKLRGKQAAVGLKQGYMTRFHPRCVQSGHVFVGNHCRVHSTCKVTGPVVINHGASIDRMTSVENSVILDNSIVGEHLNVINAIVSGSTIIRVDTGAVIDLSDKFLLSERGDSFFKAYGTTPLNRAIGAVLTVVLSPVMLLAIAHQCFVNPTSVFQRRTYIGNEINPSTSERDEFITYVIDNDNSRFRYLPMLLSVVSGEINLFGVSPLTVAESASRMHSWQKVTEEAPVGLIGPTQLYVGMDAPLDERLLSDAMSSQTKVGVSGILELLVKCVQSPFVKNITATS